MKQNIKLNKLVYSVVALALSVVLLITTSFSWLMSNFTSDVSTDDYITITADAGLEMNYGDKDNNQGSIDLDNVKLSECSSVDGRNFFFPVSNYANGGDDEFVNNVNTSDLVFREGTANDKNRKYISVDFTLSAESATKVWLSNESKIYCTNKDNKTANAIRIAFVENKIGGKTTVFDNSSTYQYVEKNNAVQTLSATGEATTEVCNVRSFNEFTFESEEKENQLFDIAEGETLKVTMNIWLEGTDEQCTQSVLNLSDLQIFIKFTTTFEQSRTIYFIDQTLEKWVEHDTENGTCYVFAIDDHGIVHDMVKSNNYTSDYTWSVSVPESTKSLRFVRYNSDKYVEDKEFNFWEAGDLGTCSTYVAFGHNTGMWSENFQGTVITLLDGTPNGYLRQNNEEILINFNINDGNGNPKDFNYKLSYQNEYYRWQIVIPSSAKNISFTRMDSTFTTSYESWTNLGSRGDNQFVTLNTYNTGYWGNQLIYVQDYEYDENNITIKVKGDDAVFATCFYTGDSDHTWTAMRAHFTTANGEFRYVAVVPAGKTKCTITRYNPSAETWGWNWGTTVYNQTADYTGGFNSANLFKTSKWTNDKIHNESRINGTWYKTDTTW